MPKQIKVFILFFFFSLVQMAAIAMQSKNVDLLEVFRNKENSSEKFDFFFDTPNRYNKHSAYDWLDDVKIYLKNAEKIRDTKAVQLFNIIKAQIYYDIGDYNKSIAFAKELPRHKDSLESKPLKILLTILDQDYGGLKMFDKQIFIREEKTKLGYSEGINFYDIYEKMGLYRRAMNRYVRTVSPTISDNDDFSKAKHHNKIGNYLRLDKSEPTAITELNKASGHLKVAVSYTHLTLPTTPYV